MNESPKWNIHIEPTLLIFRLNLLLRYVIHDRQYSYWTIISGFQKAALSARFSAKRTGSASLWGISAPKAARPPWWSSGCWLPLPAGRARRAAQPQGPGAVDGPAEAGGEKEVRTQGRRPVCGGRRRGREAGGGAADAATDPVTAPPSLRARASVASV